MLLFTLLKSCTGIVIAGSAIAIPTYLSIRTTRSSVTNQEGVRGRTTSTKETVSTSQEQIIQDQKFDNCLGQNLNFKVTNISSKETQIVTSREVGKYLDRSKWTVESLYSGQCNRSIEQSPTPQ